MSFEFIYQTLKISLALAAFMASGIYLLADNFIAALSLFLGTLWGGINVVYIKKLLQSTLSNESKNIWKIAALFTIKFPLLYLVAYAVITVYQLPVVYCMIGFSLIFAAFFVHSVRRLFKPSATHLALFLIAGIAPTLHAELTTQVPEVPNFFTLLYAYDTNDWTAFLHKWDAIFFSLFIATVISAIFCMGATHRRFLPQGLQNFLEYCVETFQMFIREIIGPKGDKFVPFLGTIFIYILTMNWMVLIPFMKSPSSSLSVTVALALCVFIVVQYLSIKNFGIGGYLYHLAGSPKGALEWALVPLMFPIELLTQLSRPITLAFRLFGNVIGEDILIGVSALFGATFLAGFEIPLGLPLQLPFMLFAMLTGLMQALVFTLLSSIYILLAMSDHE